ncbi:S41 family peptidase [Capillimicrobium parvum]|uniref:Carboxy-terminal processing protease CtpA n=1 Tax=Capillimicrobium parvum TaxID=2884022 RepID=A0A9E6XWK5_9ACTN|nr:S41 family peptidase [Capillimicrobium parvum]UGS35107.1 Carboxy-terminal processing protease CtpA [Capillimicrobium parvum]
MRRPLLYVLPALAGLVLLALGIWLGGHPDRLPDPVRDALVRDQKAQLFDEALDDVAGKYYRKVDESRLTDDAIAGMVAKLNDRYSHYFTPKDYSQYVHSSNAQFVGVGITVTEDDKGLKVAHVYDGSPAQRAGVKPGDLIVEAAGQDLAGLSSKQSSARIRGPEGTKVKLALVRDGRRITRDVERAVVSVPVVASRMRRTADGTKVAQVALSTFSRGAHGELRQEIDKRLKQGAKGILLDLRHNGGGLLDEARLVSSIFVPDGKIVTIRGRNQPTKTLDAVGGAISTKIPVAVLVDGDTASAAEIVSGAIQDHHRGEVVGTRTFGKGVFQEVMRLSNGGALDLTVGEYFLPSGRNLGGGGVKRGRGIQPDVKAPDNPKTKPDETVDAGVKVLAGQLGQ